MSPPKVVPFAKGATTEALVCPKALPPELRLTIVNNDSTIMLRIFDCPQVSGVVFLVMSLNDRAVVDFGFAGRSGINRRSHCVRASGKLSAHTARAQTLPTNRSGPAKVRTVSMDRSRLIGVSPDRRNSCRSASMPAAARNALQARSKR